MRKGFSLVEMLVVIGILGVLLGAGLTSFSAMTSKAQKAKAQEQVIDVAAALEGIYQKNGFWPKAILKEGSGGEGELTADVAYVIKKNGFMALTSEKGTKTTGLDACGIVSPWASDVIKKLNGSSASDSTKVPSGGTIKDHRLRFAIDDDGDGEVKGNVGGETVTIRGVVMVWGCGKDGEIERYSKGKRGDDVYSWGDAQRKK